MIAVVSTVVVVVGLISASSPRPAGRGCRRPSSTRRGLEALPAVAIGLWLNIRVMLVCGVLIAIFGLLIAVLRTLRGPIFFPVRVVRGRATRTCSVGCHCCW